MDWSGIGKPCGDEQETYAEHEGCKVFRKSGNSHIGLLVRLSAVSVLPGRLSVSLKGVYTHILIDATFHALLSVFSEAKVPVIFSILLDQGIDEILEYPQSAFSNFRGLQAIFFNPPVDGPSADI